MQLPLNHPVTLSCQHGACNLASEAAVADHQTMTVSTAFCTHSLPNLEPQRFPEQKSDIGFHCPLWKLKTEH